MAVKWNLVGTYFEACNCETVCPCLFLSPPSTGECTALFAWHVNKGNFGDVALDGLNVALALYSPGHMAQVKWKAALYLDERASQAQKDALTEIFSGQVGGHPAFLVSFVDQVLGVKNVTFDYRAEGKRRTLQIHNVAEAEIEAVSGQGGAEVMISNQPLCVTPGQPGVVAKSERLSYRDHGMNWEISGKHGLFSAFVYQGP